MILILILVLAASAYLGYLGWLVRDDGHAHPQPPRSHYPDRFDPAYRQPTRLA